MVKTILNESIAEYCHTSQYEQTNELNHILTISDSLFLETFLMKVRGKSIAFSTHLKKTKATIFNDLENRILQAEDHIKSNFQNILVSESNLAKLTELKKEMEKLIEEENKIIEFNTSVQWYQEGEKPSKYFCKLENRSFTSKIISKLVNSKGDSITNTQAILSEQK